MFSGVAASGVRVIDRVFDSPGCNETGGSPLKANPAVASGDRVIDSGTLPTLVTVIMLVTATPGVVFSVGGLAVKIAPWTAGTIVDAVADAVTLGSLALVAETVNDSCVPTGGTWLVACR